VPIFVKIGQEMRPWECSQTDTHTDRRKPIYNLSHAICYRYGTDNNYWKTHILINLKQNASKTISLSRMVFL